MLVDSSAARNRPTSLRPKTTRKERWTAAASSSPAMLKPAASSVSAPISGRPVPKMRHARKAERLLVTLRERDVVGGAGLVLDLLVEIRLDLLAAQGEPEVGVEELVLHHREVPGRPDHVDEALLERRAAGQFLHDVDGEGRHRHAPLLELQQIAALGGESLGPAGIDRVIADVDAEALARDDGRREFRRPSVAAPEVDEVQVH